MITKLNQKQLSRYKALIVLLLSNIFFFSLISCKKEKEVVPMESLGKKNIVESNGSKEPPATYCGQSLSTILYAGQTMEAGTVVVRNDADNIYVTYTTTNGWLLMHTHLHVGLLENIPSTPTGNPKIGLFPYQMEHTNGVTNYTYTIPAKDLPACFIVAAHAEVQKTESDGTIQTQTGWGNGTMFSDKGSWATYFNYCKQACQSCNIASGDFHTQTQGAWGASPQGNNWGNYLHQNFTQAFPFGVTIGSHYTVTFTSAEAITVFLPQGGTPSSLTSSSIDPQDVSNVLAGQVLTLTLSLGFSDYDPSFQKSTIALGSLKVKEGMMAGKSVAEVLQEANLVLGGSSTAFTPSEMNTIVTAINENFDNGTVNNGFLTCP